MFYISVVPTFRASGLRSREKGEKYFLQNTLLLYLPDKSVIQGNTASCPGVEIHTWRRKIIPFLLETVHNPNSLDCSVQGPTPNHHF